MHWGTLHPVTKPLFSYSPLHFCSLGLKPLFLCSPKLLAFCKHSAAILGDDGVCFAAEGEASQWLDPPKCWQREAVGAFTAQPSLSRQQSTCLGCQHLPAGSETAVDGSWIAAGKALARFWEGSLAPGVATQMRLLYSKTRADNGGNGAGAAGGC